MKLIDGDALIRAIRDGMVDFMHADESHGSYAGKWVDEDDLVRYIEEMPRAKFDVNAVLLPAFQCRNLMRANLREKMNEEI